MTQNLKLHEISNNIKSQTTLERTSQPRPWGKVRATPYGSKIGVQKDDDEIEKENMLR